ncbi:MAG: hypothetical protein WCO06_02375 [Candidatus Roizmanbacteria bacterium]
MLSNIPILAQIESEIALFLIKKVSDRELDEKECAHIAQQVLDLFPENIDDKFLENAFPHLKEIYPELTSIYIKYSKMLHDKKNSKQIEHVKEKIQDILYDRTRAK